MCGVDGELGVECHSSGSSANTDGTSLVFVRRIHGKRWNLKPVCEFTGLHQRGVFDAALTRFLLQLNREVRLEVRLAGP